MSASQRLLQHRHSLLSSRPGFPPGRFMTWSGSRRYLSPNGVVFDAGAVNTPVVAVQKALRMASGRVVAMVFIDASTTRLLYSDDDGVTWTTGQSIASAISGGAARLFLSGGVIYASVTYGNTFHYKSTDGASWSAVPNIPVGANSHVLSPWRGGAVALVPSGGFSGWTSTDAGATWNPLTMPIDSAAYHIELPSGRSIVIGRSDNTGATANRAWSDDGVAWTTLALNGMPSTGLGVSDAKYVPFLDRVVVVRNTADMAFSASSSDGTTWTGFDLGAGTISLKEIDFSDNLLAFSSANVAGLFAVSSLTPLTWATGGPGENINGVVWHPTIEN